MSNQSIDGLQVSQPFINDKEYSRLSLDQLKYILEEKKKRIKDDYKELNEKQKVIRDIRKIDKLSEKIKQGVDIVKERKKKSKPKKIKSFDENFQESIENKEFPADTPPYFREALERAIKEYHQGLVKKNQLLKTLLISILLKEILVLLQLNFLIEFMQL